jgi:hypothetical protein
MGWMFSPAADKCYPMWSPAASTAYTSLGLKLTYSGNDVKGSVYLSTPSLYSYSPTTDTSGERCANTPRSLDFRANTCIPDSTGLLPNIGSVQLVLKLSAGSIAGIVIGSIAVVAVLALLYLRSAKKGPFRPKDGATSSHVTSVVQLSNGQMMAVLSSITADSAAPVPTIHSDFVEAAEVIAKNTSYWSIVVPFAVGAA